MTLAALLFLLSGCRNEAIEIARLDRQAAEVRADAQVGVAQAQAAGLAAQAAADTEQRRLDSLAAQANAAAAMANSNAAIAATDAGYKIVREEQETVRALNFNQYIPVILIVLAILIGGGAWMFFDHRRKMKALKIEEEFLRSQRRPVQIIPPERQIPADVVRYALSVGVSDAEDIQQAQDGSQDWFVYEPNKTRATRLKAQPKMLTVSR
jgi:hypothetical protein